MSEQDLRLEALKLAVSYGSIQNIKDPIALADTYLAWVKESGDKQKAPQRKPMSKAD
jgi:hypothetical protein